MRVTYRCEVPDCDKVYTSKAGLFLHNQAIHKGVRYKCSVCGREFAYKRR